MALFPRLKRRLKEVLGQVTSPTVSITVSELWKYYLDLTVDKTSGNVGDVFTFHVRSWSSVGGWSTPVDLYKNAIKVGSGRTDGGVCDIPWTADEAGTFSFHAEAETPPGGVPG